MLQTTVQRRLLLLVFVLLLIPVGMVSSQSSASFVSHRFVMLGGGTADSAGYSVTTVIGQPATDITSSASYKVSGGFLQPHGRPANTATATATSTATSTVVPTSTSTATPEPTATATKTPLDDDYQLWLPNIQK